MTANFIGGLANAIGAPEPALRLLISLLLGYPLSAIYRKFIYQQPSTVSHLFFAVTGFFLCFFNYGYDAYHSLIAIWTTYLIMHLFYGTKFMVIVNFIFHMSYLLVAYYFTESENYDINWTMPHCVLVLRLIGLVFDVSDGLKPNEEQSKDQKETALDHIPSILELSGFTYFPASCLVGPQFPFRRYERFTNKEFERYTGYTRAGLIRAGLGLFYLVIRQIGAIILPDTYFFNEDFEGTSFGYKCLVLAIWGKISLYKYVSCWLLAEGVATCFGLTFAGIDKNGNEDWSGCSNIKLVIFEKASKLGHYVQSFNVNTNHWVAQYIYKRLKFLNNRTISYASALIFLAIWHGFHTGYYMCFFMEYLVITFEKQVATIYDGLLPKYGTILESTYAQAVMFVLRQIYTLVGMGWCLTPFIYLSYDKWLRMYNIYSYMGFQFLGYWFLGHFLYKKLMRRPKVKVDDSASTKQHSN